MNKKILIPIMAAAAVGMATPALAQTFSISVSSGQNYGYAPAGYGYGPGYAPGHDRAIEQRQAQLERQVHQLAQRGYLTRDRHRMYQRLFQHVNGLKRQYARNGYSPAQRRELHAQLDRIEYNLRMERRDNRRDHRRGRR